jgi:signal transduction histidine kinase
MTRDAALEIVLVATLSALIVGIAGILAAWLLRSRALSVQLAIVAVVAAVAPYAGLIAITRQMFLSEHDLAVATWVGSAGAVVSILVAVVLGVSIARWSGALRENVRRWGKGGDVVDLPRGPREFRELSEALEEARSDLAASRERERLLDQSRRDLVSWVSHDLRTPLAGIRAIAEALEDDMAVDTRRYLGQMRRDVDRMTTMVDDLFELSKIHAGVVEPRLEDVTLRDLVSEAIASADPVARSRQITIDGHIPDGVRVMVDPAALSRALSNLVMNAIRHTPPDGVVEVSAATTPGAIELSVTDGCGGIPSDDLPRVFEVGWRGTSARTPGDGIGTRAGLGLAIVRGIVEAHRGEVSVQNLESASGCRFLIRLPA